MAYDLHGFSHLISTGCTSSTDALGYAYRNLKLGVVRLHRLRRRRRHDHRRRS